MPQNGTTASSLAGLQVPFVLVTLKGVLFLMVQSLSSIKVVNLWEAAISLTYRHIKYLFPDLFFRTVVFINKLPFISV